MEHNIVESFTRSEQSYVGRSTIWLILITVFVVVKLPECRDQERDHNAGLDKLSSGDTGLTLGKNPGAEHQLGQLNPNRGSV